MGILVGPRLEAKAHRLIAQTVTIFQHQQLFSCQIRHCHAVALRPWVIGVHRQLHGFIKQRDFNKGFRFLHQGQDRAVQFTAVELRQQLLGLRFMQVHFQLGKGFVQRRNDLRQQIRSDGRDQADMQRPGHGFTLLAGHLFQNFDFAQHGTRLFHQQQTCLGE